jgi:hypothetical protein
MTIRVGGNPNTAMAAMPLREWTRRLGALPVEAYHCFMVGVLWTQPITSVWRELPPTQGRLPSDHQSSRTRSLQHAAVLTSVQDKGALRAALKKRAVLDRRCARRLWHLAVGAEESLRRGRTKERAKKAKKKKRRSVLRAPLTRKAPYKPDTGNRYVRFDERGWETGCWP